MDKVTRQCPQTTTFWRERRAEAVSNRGPSAYQPNALPLGQTGSRAACARVLLYIDSFSLLLISSGLSWGSSTTSLLLSRLDPQIIVQLFVSLPSSWSRLDSCCVLLLLLSWCLMSSDVIWHIRDKLWPMPKHGSIRKVYACLAVTCHLHFWQNDRDFLRATVITRGWNVYRNKSQHRKSTLEKKILPPFQQGFEPATFQSRVRRSTHWAILAPLLRVHECCFIQTVSVEQERMIYLWVLDCG